MIKCQNQESHTNGGKGDKPGFSGEIVNDLVFDEEGPCGLGTQAR